MRKVEFDHARAYHPPKHFGMTALKLHGREETGTQSFWVGLSHFLPGGGAEYDYEESPTEKVYVVLAGELTVKTKSETVVLREWDSLCLAPNEGREVINATNRPASMLVIVNYGG
ncbi:cupin domain-containing protein [Brevibacillus fluminis]|uniref:cupin domain-containing protein n=1 Tax=Brevibacillus fluminis TaxID=511487 RepID=UPI003F89D7C0